ncbi:MAG: Phosphate import ATP-binding protein PstB 3 [candidate division WS2 bacterium]|nr:Phosphate import ATP-binding protein PstB 3 [Candidatus Lithacetigena glycinireducens]
MDKIVIENFSLHYGNKQVLKQINLGIPQNKITAIIGPSGCGKSSLLRCINRLNDLIPTAKVEGKILINDKNIYSDNIDVTELRQKVGMVFQKPNPFPKSIYENVAYGLRINGMRDKKMISQIVERSLKDSGLYDEVKERLFSQALELSGGQQQRLCIARALAIEPEVILLDEPCSALDPASTYKIEDLMCRLKEKYTIIIVTHNMQQAARVSDFSGLLYLGELIEFDKTTHIFTNPQQKLTAGYISGHFG